MIITRIYTGDDGQSHMEDFDLDDHVNPESLLSVSSIVFRINDPGQFSDWHCGHAAITSLQSLAREKSDWGMDRLTESAQDGLCWSKT